MAALIVGIMLSPLNVMFTSVALPTMRDYFQVNVEAASWIGTAYFIPSVALMPFQSQLGQRWGFRRVYSIGLVVLAAGAFLAALAPTFQWLLASRVVQGIGWSALYPLALALINRQFPAAKHGEMMGLWESSVGLTAIIAPLAAGLLVQTLSWRSLYIGIGLVAVLGFLLTRLAVPTTGVSEQKLRSDWMSVLILTIALILTLTGITRLNPTVLLIALVAWAAWVIIASKVEEPTIPPHLFGNRGFISASFAANIRLVVAIAALTALPLFFEDVQGLNPSLVGALMVIYSLFLFLGSWPGGRWSDRKGAAVPGSVGYIAMIAGILMLLGMGYQLVAWFVAIALAVRGFGAGLSQAPYAKAATEAVPPAYGQAAAGVYGTIRFSGLALGSALVGVFLQSRLSHYDAATGGNAALPAYRELWLLLAAILVVGLAATLIMGRYRSSRSLVEIVENGRA
jgi:MFS family permease